MPYMFMCVCICAEACGGGSLCVCLHFLSAVNRLPCYRDYIHPHVLPDLYHEFAPTSDPETDSYSQIHLQLFCEPLVGMIEKLCNTAGILFNV